MTSHTKPIATSEYDAVIEAAQAYIDGYRAGDISGIERASHKDSIMWGYSGNDLLQGPATPVFASFFKSLGASPNVRSRLDIFAIAPTGQLSGSTWRMMLWAPASTTFSLFSRSMVSGRSSPRYFNDIPEEGAPPLRRRLSYLFGEA
jgi:hypothetical protein